MIREIAPRRRLAAGVMTLILAIAAAPLLALNALRRRVRPVSRILVIEPWGIGDLVLATGALRSLRAAFPDARLTVLAKPYAQALVIAPEMADEVVPYDFPWTAFSGKYRLSRYRVGELVQLIWRLRRTRYDLVLNARADARNNMLGALIGGSQFVSVKCGLGDFLATTVVVVSRNSHRVDDWASVMHAATGMPTDQSEPLLTVNVVDREQTRAELGLPVNRAAPVVGIHPGARIAVRRWEMVRFAAVADTIAERLGATLLVFAEPDGYGADLPASTRFTVVRRPLNELKAALSLCDLLICNDSGPMHIASALGVPVVAVFGPTQLEWFGPRGDRSRVVRVAEVACRPCADACIFAEAFCMTGVHEGRVVDAAVSLLATPRSDVARPAVSHPGRRLLQPQR